MSWTWFIYICTCSIKNIVFAFMAPRAVRNSKGMLIPDGDSGVEKMIIWLDILSSSNFVAKESLVFK